VFLKPLFIQSIANISLVGTNLNKVYIECLIFMVQLPLDSHLRHTPRSCGPSSHCAVRGIVRPPSPIGRSIPSLSKSFSKLSVIHENIVDLNMSTSQKTLLPVLDSPLEDRISLSSIPVNSQCASFSKTTPGPSTSQQDIAELREQVQSPTSGHTFITPQFARTRHGKITSTTWRMDSYTDQDLKLHRLFCDMDFELVKLSSGLQTSKKSCRSSKLKQLKAMMNTMASMNQILRPGCFKHSLNGMEMSFIERFNRLVTSHIHSNPKKNKALKQIARNLSRNQKHDKINEILEDGVREIEAQAGYLSGMLFPDTITHKIDFATPEVAEAVEAVKNAAVNMEGRMTILGKDLGVLSGTLTNLFKSLPFIFIITLLTYKSVEQRDARYGTVAMILISALGLWFAADLLEVISPHLARLRALLHSVTSNEAIEAQAGLQSLTEIATTLLLAYIAKVCTGSAISGGLIGVFLKQMLTYRNVSGGIKDWVQDITMILEKAINFVRINCFGYKTSIYLMEFAPEINKWREEVDATIISFQEGKLTIDAVNYSMVQRLYLQGVQFSDKVRGNDKDNGYKYMLTSYTNALKTIKAPFDQANIHGAGPRQEPVIVMLRGETGSGKSTVTPFLVKAILNEILDDENRAKFQDHYNDFVYPRLSEQQYWDDYRGQMCTLFDDFGQSVDVPGQPDNEYMGLIRCGNIFPFPLHMADLSKKGSTMFTSTLIVASTNAGRFTPNSIIKPGALDRRLNFDYWIVPAARFCKNPHAPHDQRILDPALARADPGWNSDKAVNFDVYEFYKTGSKFEHSMNFLEFVQSVASEYRSKTAYFKKYMAQLNSNDYPKASDTNWYDDISSDTSVPDSYFAEAQGGYEPKLPPIKEDWRDAYTDLLEFNTEEKNLWNACFIDGPADQVEAQGSTYQRKNWRHILERRAEQSKKEKEPNAFQDFKERLLLFNSGMPYNMICVSIQTQYGIRITLDQLVAVFGKVFGEECYKELPQIPTKDFEQVLEAFIDDIQSKAVGDFIKEVVYKDQVSKLPFSKEKLIRMSQSFRDALAANAKRTARYFSSKETSTLAMVTKGIAIFGAIAAVGFGIYSLFNRDDKKTEDKPHSDDDLRIVGARNIEIQSYDWANHYNRDIRGKKRDNKEVNRITAHGGIDFNCEEIIGSIVSKNMYQVYIGDPGQSLRLGTLLLVKGTIGLIPKHYVTLIKNFCDKYKADFKKPLVTICRTPSDAEYKFTGEVFCEDASKGALKDQDLILIDLSTALNAHSDITKYFIKEEDVKHIPNSDVSYVALHKNMCTIFSAQALTIKNINYNVEDEAIKDVKVVQYNVPTRRGHCGALCMLMNKYTPGKLVSIHVAGTPGIEGYGALVTHEKLTSVFEAMGKQAQSIALPVDVTNFQPRTNFPYPGEFGVLWDVDHGVSNPTQSAFARSKLFESYGDCKVALACLKYFKNDKGILTDPFEQALGKYGSKRAVVNPFDTQLAADSYYASMWEHSRKPTSPPKVYTFEEACEGIEGEPWLSAIPRNTSAGYPYNTSAYPDIKKGKYSFFGSDGKFDFSSPHCKQLKKEVESIIEKAKRGKRSLHIFSDFLKDERRPIKKVLEGKTRMISCAPLALTIVTRMFFLDFTKWFMENRIHNGSAVGVNVYNHEWELLFKKLTIHGFGLFAGDFSNFDGSLHAFILRQICKLINKFYGDSEENQWIRTVIFEELCSSIHINGKTVYTWPGCMPSGHPLTTIVNTIYNNIVFRYCWIVLMPENMSSGRFDDYVSMVAYGDDNVINVSPQTPWFNALSCAKVMKDLGLTYTDDNKNAIGETSFYSPFDITFLKRKFCKSDYLDRIVAPLDLDVVLDIPYWVRKGKDEHELTCENVVTSLQELSMHPPEVFNHWAPMILKASQIKLGFVPEIVQQNRLLDKVVDTGFAL